MFTAPTETQVVANLIDTYTSLITTADDMNEGSVIRSIFEAFAQELKRLYQNVQESAYEQQKMAAYSMFNFPLLPAQAAYTTETLIVSTAPTSDVTIPSGTTVSVPGTSITYQSIADAVWSSGATTAQLFVVCTQVGTIGNRFSGEVSQVLSNIPGLSGVTATNAYDIRTGRDLETDDERASRFQQFINSLHRGDTRSIPYGAKTTTILNAYGYVQEQVMKAQLVEGSGSNTVYIDNGYYNTSTALVTQCQKVINGYVDASGNFVIGYKAAGVPTTVLACSYQTVSFTVSVTASAGYTVNMVKQGVISALNALVQQLNIGDILRVHDVDAAIKKVPGVYTFTHTLSADVDPVDGTLLKFATNQPVVTVS